MFLGLLTIGFVLLSAILVFIIFLQKGKGSMGLGSLGGQSQVLFGGSGGQDMFQKITWFLLALFMGSSLVLSIAKSRSAKSRMNTVRQQLPTNKNIRR